MKIAGRSGHNPLAAGANGIVNEIIEDRKIFLASKAYLEKYNTFIDCYPNNMAGIDTELMWGINKANNNNADLFYSVHLNNAYTSYNGAIGAEIWLHTCASQDTKNKANAILNNLNKLGFINRGIKYSDGLAELNSTNMEAMIIECFFCEATGDVNLYKKHGADKIGLAIANGIDSRVSLNNTSIQPVKEPKPVVKYNESIPTGDNIFKIPNTNGYIEQVADGRLIVHKDKGNYITIGKGFIDLYWNNNDGKSGNKRLSD